MSVEVKNIVNKMLVLNEQLKTELGKNSTGKSTVGRLATINHSLDRLTTDLSIIGMAHNYRISSPYTTVTTAAYLAEQDIVDVLKGTIGCILSGGAVGDYKKSLLANNEILKANVLPAVPANVVRTVFMHSAVRRICSRLGSTIMDTNQLLGRSASSTVSRFKSQKELSLHDLKAFIVYNLLKSANYKEELYIKLFGETCPPELCLDGETTPNIDACIKQATEDMYNFLTFKISSVVKYNV